MTAHVETHVETQTKKRFKLKTSTYQLSFEYGSWILRKVINGVPSQKTEITNNHSEAVFTYLAGAERCTAQEAREAYNNAPVPKDKDETK